jgi:hypothetical protein
MTLLGLGAVTIWNDIDPAGREIFYGWHEQEHMIERVGIPGFLRGRRYIAIDAEIEWFTLYETTTAAVMSGPDYLARLNSPTEWTRRAVREFRNVTRGLTEVIAGRGVTDGACLLAAGLTADEAAADHLHAEAQGLIEMLAGIPGISAAHLTEADRAASRVETAEKRERGTANEVPDIVAMIEASRPEPLAAARAKLDATLAGIPGLRLMRRAGTYRLEFEVLAQALDPKLSPIIR